MAMERVQKILAQVGIASRRKAEQLIVEGLVTINGKVAKLGDKAQLGQDAIKVKGKLLQTAETPTYIAFNKPKGVISMMADPQGRATLADFLTKIRTRLFPIGRLDFNSEGLILLTNDGDFAEKMQKRDNIPRVYHVKVKGHPTSEMIARLTRGGRVGNKKIRPHSVRLSEDLASKAKIEVVMIGSGGTDLKTLFDTRGFLVERMVRTAIGHITLHGIRPGEYRLLRASQVQALLNQPELGMRLLAAQAEKAGPQRSDDERPKVIAAKKASEGVVIKPAASGKLKKRRSSSYR